MLKNYINTAIRNLLKNKIFSLISISGLSVGISLCLLAALYLNEELNFDRFHRDVDRIFRVVLDKYEEEGAFAATPYPVGPAMLDEFPEIEAMTRVSPMDNYLVRNESAIFFERVTVVDSGFFNVFSFKLLKGNPSTALSQPNQIVLTERMAEKYFGTADPIGKMLLIGSSGRLNSVVTGIVEDPPGNSQLQFGFLLSFATIRQVGFPVTLWFQMPANSTYVKLREHVSMQQVVGLLPGFVNKYVGARLKESYEANYKLTIQPLTDVHFDSGRSVELPTQGNRTSLYLFSSVALVILFIACINYINLTTARYMNRAREVSVRKVSGASQVQVIGQLLSESLVLAFVAGIVSALMVVLLIPHFNNLTNSAIGLDLRSPLWWAVWLVLVMMPALGAGLFPALFLARTNIVYSLKNALKLTPAGFAVRKVLVVVQLVTAAFLLTATIVEVRQMDFIRRSLYSHDGGEQVMVFPINRRIATSFDAVTDELLRNPSIMSITASNTIPGFGIDRWTVRRSPEESPVTAENFVVDDRYIDVMGYELVAGRNFSRDLLSDSNAFVINEKAVREFGLGSAEAALGKELYWSEDNPKKGQVIGVLKDFNVSNFHEEIEPALLQLNTAGWRQFAAIRVQTAEFQSTLEAIRKAIGSIDQTWIVDYQFMDDNFEKLHKRDMAQAKVFEISAGVAVFISCLGLLGLIMFTASQRTREMGIRKTLGANAWRIGFMIVKDFLILSAVACAVAFPLSYYATRRWLDGFAYRIDLTFDIYVIVAVLILFAVLLAISYQILKLARVNPATVLKAD